MKPLYQELPFAVDSYINFYREVRSRGLGAVYKRQK